MAGTMQATVSERISLGGTDYLYFGTLVPDASYATAGDTITQPASGIGLPEKIKRMTIDGGGGGYQPEYNPATGKVKIFTGEATGAGAGAKEVANAVDLSAQKFQYTLYGC